MQTEFFQNGITFRQLETQFPLGTDTVLLADFAKDCKGKVCDLCAGCGQVGLLLAAAGNAEITCVELQEQAHREAEQNIVANGLGGRMCAVRGDVREIRTLLPHSSFDAAVCNPPYFPADSGFAAKNDAIAVSRTELCCTLKDVCHAAAWLLKTGGSFYLVHRPERLTDVLTALRECRLEPKLLRFVQHREGAPYSLVLIKSVYGGKPGLSYLPTLVLHSADGTDSAEYRKIYHMEDT